MNGLEQELLQEVDWRTNELSIIRTIPILCNCNDKQKEILEKYSVVAIYSIWEGFVTQSFTLYIREINNFKLSYEKINLNILTYDIFIKYGLTEEQIKHFEHKCKFVNNIFEYSKLPVMISSNIPTESNVNFKVINKILKHFHLEELPANDFERRLNKLLKYRNNIAHGEFSLPVTKEIIQDFNSTVIDSMHEVTIRIIEGVINKKYLRF
ncbi:hypothetical protein METP2_01459 [Methanosarcinales archaeon]|nr:MAE_28990/MAE_18760 family HEPN-like nuclease [Candidatus Methanoperedens sp.]CAG0972170.1 hypothetical protein METP2_01459 [Methanosarcinales archaeon]